jgi:ribonuclease H-related protein
MKPKKYYAYLIPRTGARGVTDSWPECDRKVKGVFGARYRGFTSPAAAEAWLAAGAQYEAKIPANLAPGIYFDAGTGRGDGVEISVTDEKGKDMLVRALAKSKINRFGKHLLARNFSNNYGELLACKYALKLAIKEDIKKIFGDSKLVIDFWSRGFYNDEKLEPATIKLIGEVKKLRAQFDKAGGMVGRVSGADNPADLGFH